MAPVCKLPEESDASMRARLFTSLSQSFPHSQLYKALHGGGDMILNGGDGGGLSDDDDDSLYGDHLSNSCFASLRMDRRDSDDFDDDLRSLEWLQSEDLLKNIGGEKLDKDEDGEEQKENEDVKPDINLLQAGHAPGQQPNNLPYMPQKHVNSKPPYSFSCLIFMAVENSPKKMLPVKDIYNWILKQFPYFQNAPTGWKNSVRHNLSLNKCFKKVEKDKGQSIGKGSLWCIDPAYRPNLLQALRKTPYHPYHQLQMTSTQPPSYINMQYQSLPGGGRTVLPLTQRPIPNTVSPHLFPFLSRRLAQTSFDVDNEMKDVAQTLVALKGSYKKESPDSSPGEDIGPTWKYHKRSYSYNNPRKRPSSPVVVTGHPYDDHAYSSTRLLEDDLPSPSSSSSIDEEYDFGDADEEGESDYQSDSDWDSDDKDEVDGVLPSTKKLKIDMDRDNSGSASKPSAPNDSEDDEQKKIQEGANALLNLAGLLMSNRSSSSTSNSNSVDGREVREEAKSKRKAGDKKKVRKKQLPQSEKKREPKEKEEGSQRKRGFSKRKNAGSNGKYDSEEYSLLKPRKNTKTKGTAGVAAKPLKSGVSKSSAEKDSSFSSNSAAKSKAPPGRPKGLKKAGVVKKKLKLSKSFGTKKNIIAGKSETALDSKTQKKRVTSAGEKKCVTKTKLKSSTAEKGNKDTEENMVVTQDVFSSSSNANNLNNNNNVVKDDSSPNELLSNNVQLNKPKSPSPEQILKEPVGLIADSQPSLSSLSSVSGEELTPAGDAPVKSACRSLAGDFSAAANEKVSSAPTDTCSSLLEETVLPSSKTSSSKSGLSGRSTPVSSAGSPGAAHKSPHFTRFSKKKAALS
ncbi:uncharacterized protein LOC101846815 isoform X2 [Aplysia californica]|nr:uncharacterized protein LOC101846815 isoform X2 [Aplysia californica]